MQSVAAYLRFMSRMAVESKDLRFLLYPKTLCWSSNAHGSYAPGSPICFSTLLERGIRSLKAAVGFWLRAEVLPKLDGDYLRSCLHGCSNGPLRLRG